MNDDEKTRWITLRARLLISEKNLSIDDAFKIAKIQLEFDMYARYGIPRISTEQMLKLSDNKCYEIIEEKRQEFYKQIYG